MRRLADLTYEVFGANEVLNHEQINPPVDAATVSIVDVGRKERTFGEISVGASVYHQDHHQTRHHPDPQSSSSSSSSSIL